jgi:hypothetical protein
LLWAEGQFVVIRGDELVGVERTYGEALELGYRACGLGPWLLKQVLAEEPAHWI